MSKKRMKKFASRVIALALSVMMLPVQGFAVQAADSDDKLTATMEEAKSFIDGLTINNSSNDPSTVVSTWGSEFSWDNEKRESNKKDYLFEWSYYSGVVFEGLDYIYDVTKDTAYSDYVKEYLSAMITEDGEWATCSNNSAKECAGYNSSHGADCYKTASLLLDYYQNTDDIRYLTMAKTLYTDLQNAQSKNFTSNDRGGNYNHTWASTPAYAVWLDGIYMIQPFMAEYAAYINDTDEINKIAERFAWVSENMYSEETGLFYHAANSSSSYYNNNGSYWGRAIGWYAAAMVDVMDYMTSDNLTAMKIQFKKLVDGMLPYQADDGMWRQFVNVSSSTEETSVTALMAYAIQKAVNNGWLDSSYAAYAEKAFIGMCDYALDDSGLHYICFKGSTSSYSDPSYSSYVNEGKGVGPFIMAYAEIVEAQNKAGSDDSIEEETPIEQSVTINGTTIKVANVSGSVTGAEVTADDKVLVEAKSYKDFVAYDLTATLIDGQKAAVSIPVPKEWNATADELIGISVEDGVVKEIEGTLSDGVYSFEVGHFSAKGIALTVEGTSTVSGTGNLVSGKVYTLDTDGVTANKNYLIVNTNTGTGYALTNNESTTPGSTEVTISANKTITVKDDTNIAWIFSDSASGTVKNNGYYVYLESGNVLSTKSRTLSISDKDDGAYQIYYRRNNRNNYLKYNDGWSRAQMASNVYLYEYTEVSAGEAVTFSVTPGSKTLTPDAATTLTGTVTVDGETVDLSNCVITWESSNTAYATVVDGTVTGVDDGTVNITATLSAVNGTSLQENIVLTIPMTVQSKTVTSATLTGNDPVTTKQNVEPDFSNIELKVIYDDGTTGTITVDNGLVIEGYDSSTIGYTYATISYNGVQYGTVRVTVEGNPYEGLENATEYPEYPADGAVRIDKTATEVDFENTGVVQVELDVAGISVKSAVDVILVTDLSNSMAWAAGGRTDATFHEDTKIYDLQQSVASFADIFLAADDDGNATKNTMSLVTFGGYDANHTKTVYSGYADPTQTLLLGSSDASIVKSTINNIRLLADDALNIGTSTTGYYLSFDGGTTYGENYGNTNYDHAFMQTADAIAALKASYRETNGTEYDDSGRQIYVVFMTDGAPSNYDGVYYNYKTGDRADVNCTWIDESGSEITYIMGSNNSAYGADSWYQYIAGGSYNSTTDTIPGNPLYWADQVYNTTCVANIYNIGFDLDNGGFSSMTFTQADGRPLSKVLENLVTGQTLEIYSADDEEGLKAIYSDLATKIRYAGTSANVSDTVDSNFTLQMTQTTGSTGATVNGNLDFKPTITVTSYDLWTKEETNDNTLIGTRKTNEDKSYICTVIETVSFNDDGTEAYSDMVENGTKNILVTAEDGTVTIEAHYFTYTKTPEGVETFKWNIGNITDQEVALSYYAYLTGALEGERAKGLYYTNEEATLEYVDINGDHATQIFPIPAVAWGGASTAYEFYLVNEEGEPCDRNGNVIPFANRIIITGPYYEELYLNQEDEEVAREIVAAKVLPAGYTLYDETASYIVVTASGDIEGRLTVSTPAEGKNQTTIVVSATEPSYIQSRVAFGVLYNEIPDEATFELTPDKVVIDYGKSIIINIGENNLELEEGYKASLVGFSKYYDSVELNTKFSSTSAIDKYDATYGVFTIADAEECKVCYTPTNFVDNPEMIFCVIKMINEDNSNDVYYMVDWLTVIPATNVYYETDFANVFTLETTGDAWKTAVTDKDEFANAETSADNLQDDGTVGVNQTYGYDSSYTDDKYLSNASSLKVEGAGVRNTTAKFSFTGTGFDLISRTGTEQGSIRVDIYTDEARTAANRVKSVTVLNKSESNLELYQIPVVSVNDLPHNTYYVTIGVSAAYDDPDIDELDRGGEFYFDAIRIYDPVKGNSEAEKAYVEDGESSPIITEVRAQLIAAEDYDVTDSVESVDGMTFIDKTQEGADIKTYTTIGPNNEVYLSKDQAIAFEISSTADLASIDVAAKAPNSGAAAQLTANISSTVDTTGTGIQKEITSATPQYFDLMENAATDLATVFANGKAYVVIRNTGEGVLSITDIKVAYGNVPGTVAYSVNENAITFARTVINSVESEEPDYDIISAGFTSDTCKLFETATMTVVTSSDVEKLVLTGIFGWNANPTILSTEENADGQIVWTIQMRMYILGNKNYTVTGYGADGTAGASATASIRVKLF